MTIKVELADGTFEIFESQNYKISKPKDFHPMILKVTIFTDSKKIKSVKRRFRFLYKHFTFKSEKVQKLLKEINSNNEVEKK